MSWRPSDKSTDFLSGNDYLAANYTSTFADAESNHFLDLTPHHVEPQCSFTVVDCLLAYIMALREVPNWNFQQASFLKDVRFFC
jgi:hypothetical protein